MGWKGRRKEGRKEGRRRRKGEGTEEYRLRFLEFPAAYATAEGYFSVCPLPSTSTLPLYLLLKSFPIKEPLFMFRQKEATPTMELEVTDRPPPSILRMALRKTPKLFLPLPHLLSVVSRAFPPVSQVCQEEGWVPWEPQACGTPALLSVMAESLARPW